MRKAIFIRLITKLVCRRVFKFRFSLARPFCNGLIVPTFITFLSVALFAFPSSAFASASLSLSPSSGIIAKNSTLKVSVYANTGGESVNAVQANISYPINKLQFLSVSTGGSALTIFAEKFASGDVVHIAGGAPSPGFTGNKLIATVTFKALEDAGISQLSFTGDSAVLRDSDNANILSGRGTGSYTLGKGSSGESIAPVAPSKVILISGVTVESTIGNSAVVVWKTDSKSDSSVEYGKDTEYGFTSSSKDLVTEHRITLSELLVPGTQYHFRVKSADGTKEGQSVDATFKTKGSLVLVRVKDAKDSPISGATVTIYSDIEQSITDENGEARFENIASGKHGIIVKNDNQTVIREIEVNDTNEQVTVDISFTPQSVPKVTHADPILYGFVGVVSLLVVILVAYYIWRQKKSSEVSSDIPTSIV